MSKESKFEDVSIETPKTEKQENRFKKTKKKKEEEKTISKIYEITTDGVSNVCVI